MLATVLNDESSEDLPLGELFAGQLGVGGAGGGKDTAPDSATAGKEGAGLDDLEGQLGAGGAGGGKDTAPDSATAGKEGAGLDDLEFDEIEEIVTETITTKKRSVAEASLENGVKMMNKDGEVIPPANPKAKLKLKGGFYGAPDNVEVGAVFNLRKNARDVHSPMMAGIHGHGDLGCFSVCMSGGYAHDLDEGDEFVYTGHGGQDDKGKMIDDQKLDASNMSMIRSYELQKPVRVIRGSRLPSPFQPETGYRYDGLYAVVDWWCIRDSDGFKLYQYHFRRLQGQPPLPPPRSNWEKRKIHRTWKSVKQVRRARGDDDDGSEEVVTVRRTQKRRVPRVKPSGVVCDVCDFRLVDVEESSLAYLQHLERHVDQCRARVPVSAFQGLELRLASQREFLDRF